MDTCKYVVAMVIALLLSILGLLTIMFPFAAALVAFGEYTWLDALGMTTLVFGGSAIMLAGGIWATDFLMDRRHGITKN